MSAATESRPDLAELKRAALKKVKALTEARAAASSSSSSSLSPTAQPAAAASPTPSPTPEPSSLGLGNDAVRLLIQEKNELLAALEEQKTRADRLETLLGQPLQQQPLEAPAPDPQLLAENEALKRHMAALSDRVAELEAARAAAERELADSRGQLEERERALAELSQETETKSRQTVEDLERRLLDSIRQVEALNNEGRGLRENMEAARRERDDAVERSSTLQKSIEMLETKVRNMTAREDLAVTWKTKTERLTAENNRLLEERGELQSRLAELASSNAALTLALDTAQRHLASRPESPDPSPKMGRRAVDETPAREALPSPPASVPDQSLSGDLTAQIQALTDQNVRLAEELAKEREISERLAAQVDEIPGFIVKFVEQRQKAAEGHSPTNGQPPERSMGPAQLLERERAERGDHASIHLQPHPLENAGHTHLDFTSDMYHCPNCFESQEVFL